MKKLLLSLLLLTGLIGRALGAPSVVDSNIGTATGTSCSTTVNSNTGSNLYLMVGVFTRTAVTIDSVTHNGDTITNISTTDNTNGLSRLGVFGRLTPDVGSGLTVTANISGSQACIVAAVVVQDVDQTTPYTGEAIYDPEDNGSATTLNITSAVGDLVVDFNGQGQSSSADEATTTSGGGQTSIESAAEVDNLRLSVSTAAGAVSVTTSWSWTGSMPRILKAYNINAAPQPPQPTIGATATSSAVDDATPTVNLPSGITAGETLIVLFRLVIDSAIGWPAGWTEMVDVGSDAADDRTAIAWRKADGTEGATIDLTCGAAGNSCAIAWRITGAADPTVTPPQLSTIATGTSTTPDPTTATPTGGSKDYLWLWLGGWEGEQTSPPASNPTNYSGVVGADSGVAGPDTNNCRLASASRQLTAASEDPGSWTISVSDDWTAYTLVVHPSTAGLAGLLSILSRGRR